MRPRRPPLWSDFDDSAIERLRAFPSLMPLVKFPYSSSTKRWPSLPWSVSLLA